MSTPTPPLRREDASSTASSSTRSPLQGILTLVVGGVFGLANLVGLDGVISLVGSLPRPVFVGAIAILALVVGKLIADLLRWTRKRALSKKYPDEPWLWDHTWKLELVDQQLVTLMPDNPAGTLFILAILGAMHLAILLAFAQGELAVGLVFGGFLLVMDGVIFVRGFIPYLRRVSTFLHFGRLRLRLPEVPLALGKPYEVELVARSSLSKLPGLSATLRRVREVRETRGAGKNKTTETIREIEYEHTERMDTRPLSEGRDLRIPLELPASAPMSSTWLDGSTRRFWELQLQGSEGDVNLDTTFLLPIYAVGSRSWLPLSGKDGRPSRWRSGL